MYGIIANVIKTERSLRKDGKVWIFDLQYDNRARVYGMTRGGKRIEKYTALKYLGNFRAAWIPS